MNTMTQTPPIPQNLAAVPGATLGVIIDTPLNFTVAVCLVSPMRRIFSGALRDQLLRAPVAAPLVHGVGLCLNVRDEVASLEVIREELRALGFLSLAHIGRLLPDGWQCLHGSADRVTAFDEMMHDSLTAHAFDIQICIAYGQATDNAQ